jgi:hypothetical protein
MFVDESITADVGADDLTVDLAVGELAADVSVENGHRMQLGEDLGGVQGSGRIRADCCWCDADSPVLLFEFTDEAPVVDVRQLTLEHCPC